MAIAGRVAIVPKGDWSADATYKRLDAVTYNNTLYFAKKDVPAGTATNNTEYWSRSIVGGAGAIATKEDAGTVKPADGLTVAEDGTLKVSIDGTTLTMDQVNNVIKLADTLKDKINGAFPAANLINNLTTTEAGFGLDARQGKALDDKITEINGSLNSKKIPSFGIENIFTGNPFCIVNNGSDVISVQTDWDIDNGGYRVKDIKYPAGTATNLTVSLSLPANSIVIVDVNTLNGENIDIQGSLIRSNFTSSPKNWNLSIKFTGRTNQILTDIRYMPLVIHLG
ncbi:MAG: hypothetical protein U0J63_05435 [Roseburia faecis]|nr:hypothetical protein [Roseburia faecis]